MAKSTEERQRLPVWRPGLRGAMELGFFVNDLLILLSTQSGGAVFSVDSVRVSMPIRRSWRCIPRERIGTHDPSDARDRVPVVGARWLAPAPRGETDRECTIQRPAHHFARE